MAQTSATSGKTKKTSSAVRPSNLPGATLFYLLALRETVRRFWFIKGDLQSELENLNLTELKNLGRKCDSYLRISLFDKLLPELDCLSAETLSLSWHWLDNFGPALSNSEIGQIYERTVRAGSSNKEGVFFTPTALADRILTYALAEVGPDRRIPTILDPACGSGNFLHSALNQIVSRFGNDASFETRCTVITALFGIDRDPVAVELTKLTLLFELYGSIQARLAIDPIPDLSQNIICADFLLTVRDFNQHDPDELSLMYSLNVSEWSAKFQAIMSAGGFDCIIGNPPYGLSRDDQMHSEENKKLKKIYAEYRFGKANKYLLFLNRGFELLNQTGALCFVIPNAWLGIDAGEKLRRRFLQAGNLVKLTVFEKSVFDNASVEVVLTLLNRIGRRAEFAVEALRDAADSNPRIKAIVPTASALSSSHCHIPLRYSVNAETLFNHISATTTPLARSNHFISLIALQAYCHGKGIPPQTAEVVKTHPFHMTEKNHRDCYPYYEGRDIERYKITWSGTYLRHGEFLAEPQSLDRFSGPRILVREILHSQPYRIIAALATETALYNKSVLHILPTTATGHRLLLALLGILNSKFASFVLSYKGRKSDRTIFPKVVNKDLAAFPIPIDLAKDDNDLGTLTQERLLVDLDLYQQAQLQTKIDTAVYQSYGLTNSQVSYIEEFLGAW